MSCSADARPAVFFDRDGVLNLDHDFVHRPDQFDWVTGAPEVIGHLNQLGWRVFVVTNQSGIARGYYEEADVQALHAWMNRDLAAHGAHIDDFRYCPHHPSVGRAPYVGPCACRKPAPGMLLSLMESWPVRRAGSFLVGDKPSDLEAAAAAGLPGHRFGGGDLDRFVRDILARQG